MTELCPTLLLQTREVGYHAPKDPELGIPDRPLASQRQPRSHTLHFFKCVLYFFLPVYPFGGAHFKDLFAGTPEKIKDTCTSTIAQVQAYVIVSGLLATVTFPVISLTSTSSCPDGALSDDPCHGSPDPVKQLFVVLTAISFFAASFCALTYAYQLQHYSRCLLKGPASGAKDIAVHLWLLDLFAFFSFHIAFTSCNVAVVVAAISYLNAGFRVFLVIAGGVIIALGVFCRVLFLSAFDFEADCKEVHSPD